eukprot:m.186635 g.186635  ORF g.186635 m.186635 type:complete len:426 (-) comp32275_c4_seq3:290-1567(-)
MAANIVRGVGRIATHTLTKGSGPWLYTTEGRKILDFACGIGVTNTGHCHPKVVAAIQKQAGELMHAQVATGYHQPMCDLVEKLVPLLPSGPNGQPLDKILFTTTGAEAVENAIKMARAYTKKPNVIVFQGGYHGRSFGTMPLTTAKTVYRSSFGPFMPGIFVAPFPYSSWCETCGDCKYCYSEALNQFDLLLKQQTSATETCAVLIEPILGEGGYIPAPQGFLKALQQRCNDNDILLICDEVQSGFGRTGSLFAVGGHYNDVEPDMIVMAKGLASGVPISAVATTTKISDAQPPGTLGGTYSGNILGCAAAIATLDVLYDEGMIENASIQGARLKSALRALQDSGKYPIKDVRGLGLMVGVEFDHDVATGTANTVVSTCLQHDLMLLTNSVYEAIRFIPPLNISSAELDTGIERFTKSLDVVFRS